MGGYASSNAIPVSPRWVWKKMFHNRSECPRGSGTSSSHLERNISFLLRAHDRPRNHRLCLDREAFIANTDGTR